MAIPYIHALKTYTEIPDTELFRMHSHDDYEIYCFFKGSAKYYVEGNIYHLNSGDILLMKRAEAHSLIIDKLLPYERIVINFNSEALISSLSPELIDFLDNRPLGKQNKYSESETRNIVHYLEEICKCRNFNEQQLYLTFVLCELKKSTPAEQDINIDSIQPIVTYINNNLFNNITLDSVADQFFMSKNHINQKFKKYTGSTIWSYIITKRLITAKNLLLNGEKPTLVYEKCGFGDYCSFYRAYKKKYGISPNEESKKK